MLTAESIQLLKEGKISQAVEEMRKSIPEIKTTKKRRKITDVKKKNCVRMAAEHMHPQQPRHSRLSHFRKVLCHH